MDRDEEKKNNPFEQDAHNEMETEIESTAADAGSADHIQEDLSEEKEIEYYAYKKDNSATSESNLFMRASLVWPVNNIKVVGNFKIYKNCQNQKQTNK